MAVSARKAETLHISVPRNFDTYLYLLHISNIFIFLDEKEWKDEKVVKILTNHNNWMQYLIRSST